MVKTKKTLTQEQLLEIQKAVAAAEKTTRGEIVPVAIAAADQYEFVLYRTPILVSLAISSLFFIFLKPLSAGQLFLIQLISFILSYGLLIQFPQLKYFLLTPSEIKREVDQKSLELFYEYHLDRTEKGTGILIVIFLEERTVKVLADSGINQLVPPKTWDLVVSDMIAEIRNTHVASAMVLGIKRCGEILSQKIPSLGANRNELNDNLRTK
jgi:putative membrane protein